MAAPIANQRNRSVMQQLLGEIEKPHREMLRVFAAGEDRDLDDPVPQSDLVDATGGSNFALHFSDLREWDLVEEVGRISKREGKNTVISQKRYVLTERGRHLVSSHGPEFDAKQLQGDIDVSPEVRSNPKPVGREPDRLTDLSGSVDAFVENTEKVILHEGVEHRTGDPKGTVEVTLSHEGLQEEIEIPAVNWHNSGMNHFFDQLHAAFGAGHDLDQREWGILQARWIDMAEVVDHDQEGDGHDEVSD